MGILDFYREKALFDFKGGVSDFIIKLDVEYNFIGCRKKWLVIYG